VLPFIIQANESIARIFEVLDEIPEIRDPENSLLLDPEAVEGRVVFEHVSQSYQFMISP
jgi:ABC-type multidrug transport system fused ATPase/permease subunit